MTKEKQADACEQQTQPKSQRIGLFIEPDKSDQDTVTRSLRTSEKVTKEGHHWTNYTQQGSRFGSISRQSTDKTKAKITEHTVMTVGMSAKAKRMIWGPVPKYLAYIALA